MKILIAGIAYFVFVFFRAFQQRNVVFLNYRWILPTSIVIAQAEVLIHSLIALNIVTEGLGLNLILYALSIGVGGGGGCLLAMYLHSQHVSK